MAIGFVVLLLLSAGFAVLRVELEGPALADKISTTLNKRMRGRIVIGSIEWEAASLQKALTGGWAPLTFRDVKVWDDCALDTGAHALDEIREGDPNEDCTLDERPDPDPTSKRKPRKLLLRTDKITAEVDVHALMFGNHDFVFRNLWVHGGEVLLEQTSEPYPLHAYDRTIVSIITAFYPRMKGGFRAGIYADTPPPIFDLRDIHVKDVNLTVHMGPYSLARLVVQPSGRRPLTGNVAFVAASNFDLEKKPFVHGGDACKALTIDVKDKVVLVDGGGCTPKAKARNVQQAGAIGMVHVAETASDTPPTLDDDPKIRDAIRIAVVAIGKREGDAIRSDPKVIAGTATATLRDTVGYSTTARVLGVDIDAGEKPKNDSYLYMDSVDPLVTKFYVRLEATAKTGAIRINDEALRPAFRIPESGAKESEYGKGREAEYTVDIRDIKLHRLAQLPTEWTRKNFVANTLELDVEAKTIPCEHEDFPIRDPKLGGDVHITGELLNYWDRPYDGSWNLKIDAKNAGQTVRTCVDSDVGGANLEGTITVTGPFIALPRFGLAMKNLDYDLWLRGDREPLKLTLAEVQGWIDLVNDQGAIEKTTALINSGKEPGEVAVAATFGLKPYNARAHVEILHAIDVERFLPESAEPIGTYLQGRLTAVGDDAVGFSLENFDLALGRTPKERSFRMHDGRLFTNDEFDTVNVQHVALEAGRSRAEMNGIIDVKNDTVDLEISKGNFPDLDMWLQRFGMPGFVKSAGGGVIKIKGPISNPRVNVVATDLNGVPCLDRVTIHDSEFNSDTGVLDIKELSSAGFGGTLKGSARIQTGDKATGRLTNIEKMHVEGRRLDASKICKVGNHVKGVIDTVDVDLQGTIDPKREAMDWLSHAKVAARAGKLSVYGDRFNNLALCLNRRDDAACRPRTAYLDGDDLQQCEAGKRDKNGFCAVVTATRDGGGYVDATIARLPVPPAPKPPGPGRTPVQAPKGPSTRLGGTISLSDVPVAIIDQLFALKQAGQMGGSTSLTLHLQGDPQAPQGTGSIDLLRSWVKSSFLGDAKLALSPGRIDNMPGLTIKGTALAGRLEITGTLGTQAPYPVELVIRGSRIEVDAIMDLQKKLGLPLPVQAWGTGTVTLRHELQPKKPVEPIAWVELTELVGVATHKSEDGRIIPLRVAAVDQDRTKRPAVSLRVTPSSIEFKCRDPKGKEFDCTTKLELGAQAASAPAGVIDFKGHVTPQHMAIEAVGKLDLGPIAPLVDTIFKQVSGTADIQASISGTYEKPSYEASLSLKNVTAQRAGTDTLLQAPSGLIKLARGSLGFTGVTLRVHDKHGEDGEVHVKGTIDLDGITPKDWHLLIDGKVAGQMLLVLMPELVSQASGLARIEGDLQLTGKGPKPEVIGTLSFEPECADGKPAVAGECRGAKAKSRPLTVTVRGAHRELAFKRGALEIETLVGSNSEDRTYVFRLSDFETSIDGQGAVKIDYGYAELKNGEIAQLALRLDAESIPFRTSDGKLDLVVSGTDVSIAKTSPSADLALAGVVTIIDGTYRQDFEITEGIKSLGSTAPPSIPVWDVYPTIGNAKLDLTVVLGKFLVQSNIASIELGGSVDLRATPKDPKLSGQIEIARGRFRLPGMRAAFTRTSGTIRFDSRERAGNPDLQIQSDADYRDLSGQDHVITMTIFGRVDNLGWDLKTSTGYNKSQTVSLLLLGRNPEQLRRSLGDQTLGSDPGTIDPSTNPTQGFGDQIVKDLAGEWVSDLLENSLTRLTGLDVLRIEVGFGSIGLHAEKRMIENITLLGTSEQTIRGNTVNVRGELKTPYVVTGNGGSLSAQAGWLNKNFNDPAEEDITDVSLKLVFRLFIP